MKTVLRSFAYSLGILLVAVLINGRWFLNQDAQYTYDSNIGRIDVRIEGVTEGRVNDNGKDVRSHEPQWFKSENNQGNSLSFPVSYKSNHREIVLTPESSQISDSSKLMIKFMGQDYRIDGKRVPAKVKYKNIKINGEKISDKVVVWHDKHFKYYLNNIKDGEEIKISFDIYKPFSTSDINWAWILGFIVVVWLLTGIFLWKKDFFHKLFDRLDSVDLIATIVNTYKSIDSVYRKSFWIIFIIINVVFGFHTINFMWGNHDWGDVRNTASSRLFEGRYSINMLKQLLFDGRYLPIITNIVSFCGLALNAVLLGIYWKLPKKISFFVLCGLVLCVQPFTLEWLYYCHCLPECFYAPTFILVALLIAENTANSSKKYTLLRTLISAVLINIALSIYPASINTVAVVFMGRLLIDFMEWNGKYNAINILKKKVISIIAIVVGAVLFKIILTILYQYGIFDKNFYNIKPLPFDLLPQRIIDVVDASFKQLIDYKFPFISNSLAILSTICLFLFIIYVSVNKQNWRVKLVTISLLFLTLVSTKTACLLANDNVLFAPRIDFYGLVYFKVLIFCLLFRTNSILRNIAAVFAVFLIWISVVNDFYALRVWKLGFDAEKMRWNRMLTRIESDPNFDISKKYTLVQIGFYDNVSMRMKYYNKQQNEKYSLALLGFSWNPPGGNIGVAQNFYYSKDIIEKVLSPKFMNNEYKNAVTDLSVAGVLDKATVWPHVNSLIVHKDMIMLVTEKQELLNAKNIAQERLTQNKENK